MQRVRTGAPMTNEDDQRPKITILIVDDHPILRHGLRNLLELEDDFSVVAEVGAGQAAIACAPELRPDVILLDINLPDLNGLEVAHQLRLARVDCAIILLTAYDDPTQEFTALSAGASAYCPKDIEPDTLFQVIRWAARGNYVIGGKVYNEADVHHWLARHRDALSSAGVDVAQTDVSGALSLREMEILRAVTRGLSNKEIAHELGISHQTVRNHMSSILGKLNLEGRTQVVLYAIQRGWVRAADRRSDDETGPHGNR